MPVAKFHVSGFTGEAQVIRTFLKRVSETYAEILECPQERVRVYFLPCSADMAAIEGKVPGPLSAFFDFVVLEGRPLEQRQAIARSFCKLIHEVLGVDVGRVRGQCIRVEPGDWCIGGQFASDLRKSEIEARQNRLKGFDS